MYQYRQVLLRLRLGESDREIARDGLMGRRKVATLRTLAAASSLEKANRSSLKSGATVEAAKIVGQQLAERALQAGITEVVFDRGAYMYHGRVKSLAEGAREGGLKF